jgi:hypothetical protein
MPTFHGREWRQNFMNLSCTTWTSTRSCSPRCTRPCAVYNRSISFGRRCESYTRRTPNVESTQPQGTDRPVARWKAAICAGSDGIAELSGARFVPMAAYAALGREGSADKRVVDLVFRLATIRRAETAGLSWMGLSSIG